MFLVSGHWLLVNNSTFKINQISVESSQYPETSSQQPVTSNQYFYTKLRRRLWGRLTNSKSIYPQGMGTKITQCMVAQIRGRIEYCDRGKCSLHHIVNIILIE